MGELENAVKEKSQKKNVKILFAILTSPGVIDNASLEVYKSLSHGDPFYSSEMGPKWSTSRPSSRPLSTRCNIPATQLLRRHHRHRRILCDFKIHFKLFWFYLVPFDS